MKINNFKTIQEEDERKFVGAKQDNGRAGIWGTLGVYKFVGQLVEVYLPKAVDVLISATGASSSRQAPGDAPEHTAPPGSPSSPPGGGRA